MASPNRGYTTADQEGIAKEEVKIQKQLLQEAALIGIADRDYGCFIEVG
jgi:hypothetical protein